MDSGLLSEVVFFNLFSRFFIYSVSENSNSSMAELLPAINLEV